jgi:uncharacterized protein (DUF1697 family)
MKAYAVLLRGINVGGKNRVPMADLRGCLERLGYSDVATYIASGNVIVASDGTPDDIRAQIELALPRCFELDVDIVKVLVLSREKLQAVFDDKPDGFGEQPARYHSDAVFLMGIGTQQALTAFDPREAVDTVWAGDGVIYSQRLSSRRTESRLSKIVSSPAYKSMTIRNWQTTTKLLELLKERESSG